MARNAGTVASDLGSCEICGSHNVRQIRTGRRPGHIRIDGHAVLFMRLYLDRCADCSHIVLSGKVRIGKFPKAYLPRTEPVQATAVVVQSAVVAPPAPIGPQIASKRKNTQVSGAQVKPFKSETKS